MNNFDIKQINTMRHKLGLPLLYIKKKKCAKCSKEFSTTSKNICCFKCRSENNKHFEYYGKYGGKNL